MRPRIVAVDRNAAPDLFGGFVEAVEPCGDRSDDAVDLAVERIELQGGGDRLLVFGVLAFDEAQRRAQRVRLECCSG